MRKYLKKSVCLLLLLSLIGSPFLLNLNDSFIIETNATTIASLSETSLDLNVGETHKLTLNGATGDIRWKSSNSQVATVDNGLIKALKKGVTVITATYNGRPYMCVVTVKELTTSVKLNQNTANISVHDTFFLSANVSPITASNRKVTWSSSNPNVVDVTSTGLVVGKEAGTATIYCRAADGSGCQDTCVVTVKPIITCFYLEGSTSSISVGGTTTLDVQIYPPDYECDFIWKSSNNAVATVNDNGVVKGISPGTTLITCETSDKVRIASKYINVKELVSSLTLTGPTSMTKGSSEQFIANVTPESLEGEDVLKWKSSNLGVATVNNSGVVTAKKTGTTVISCKTTDGSAIAKSKLITVKEGTSTKPVYISKIEIMNSIDEGLTVGESTKLKAQITPSNATNKTLKWTSSNNGVVTVDQNGTIEAVGPGTATIRATSTDGYGISDSLIVKVIQPITSITINGKDRIAKNESYTYTTTIFPTNYNEKLEWKSSNPTVASIDTNGNLTGKTVGSTTISCKGLTSGKTATKEINVTANGNMITSINLSGLDTMTVGQTNYLKATITPSSATAYKFTSLNTDIATVTNTGLVSPRRAGTVTIVCEATDGSGVKAEKEITVKDRITSISINKSTVSVEKGKNISVTATVLPSTANTKAIKWKSMNEEIARVNENGEITGVSAGSTRIYCDATDGSSAYSSITVVVTESVSNIEISGNSTVTVGNTVQLTATVTPSSMQDYIEWSSSDKGIATVTSGGLVKGVKAGDVTITAKVGNKTATKTITVKSTSSGKVTINDTFKYLDKNVVVKLDVDTTSGTLSYNSSNNSVATVDNQGIITCKNAGTVTITATNGSAKDEITFTVGNYQSLFRLGYKEVNVNAGAKVWIEVAGTKADIADISQTNYNVYSNRSDVGFYNRSIDIQAQKVGSTYVTVFNSSGYGYTVKVNVLSSTDTTGTYGLSYDAQASNKLFDLINDYRREKGLNPCKFNQKAQDAAKGQVISGHRMAEVNPNYDYALHNVYQLSCYYFYNKVDVRDFLTAWKNSYGHNRALTTPSYTDMGVAVYSTPYGYCAFMTIATPLDIDNVIFIQ